MRDTIRANGKWSHGRSGLSRRQSLKMGLMTGIASALNIDPVLADEKLDIGLVAPFTGPDAVIGDRVLESLRTHEKDENNDPIYPEFKGKKLTIFTGDSLSTQQQALEQTRRLIEGDGLVHLVCGDIRSAAIKIKEPFCKEHNVDLIQACSRLKLNHSNPHPHTFQILPNLESHIGQCFEFMRSRGFNNSDPAIVVVNAGSGGFWSDQAPILYSGGADFNTEILAGNFDTIDATLSSVSTALKQAPSRPILLFTQSDFALKLIDSLAQDLSGTPVVIDSLLSDPEDLRKNLSDRYSDQIFFAAIASRTAPASKFQETFYERIRNMFDREPTPVDTLGGTALQISGRFANGIAANDIDLRIDETIFASPIKFDEQGANVNGLTRFYHMNDGLQDVTPQ